MSITIFNPRRPERRSGYWRVELEARGQASYLDPVPRRGGEGGGLRLRLLSEALAAPARPPRDRWYAAWRAVADAVAAGDLAGAVVAVAGEAQAAFRDLDAVARAWRSAADALAAERRQGGRPRAAPHPPPPPPPPERGEVERWLTDCREFRGWARAVAAAYTLTGLVRWLSRGTVGPVDSPQESARGLLGLVAAGAGMDEVAAWFASAGGVGWLSGLTGVVAGVVAPPAPGYRFRADELPTGDRVRGAEALLLRLVTPYVEWCHTHEFVRQYLSPAATVPPASRPRPPADPSPGGPHTVPPPPPPAEPPAWITSHFRSDQRKLLLALWGRVAVSAADLCRALKYPAGATAPTNLRRRVDQTNTNLADRRESIGGGWVIEPAEAGDAPAYRLHQLPG